MDTKNFSEQIILRSGVESVLDGADVICSNIGEAEYSLEDKKQIGLTANLALPGRDSWLRLGKGQEFDFQEKTYEVVEVTTKTLVLTEKLGVEE